MGDIIGSMFVHDANESRFYFKHCIFTCTGMGTQNLMVKVMKITEILMGR